MSIEGLVVPELLTTSQTWRIDDLVSYCKLLERLLLAVYPGFRGRAEAEREFSGPGVYRLQIRVNRPEGSTLVSLKWEGL